MPGMICSIIGCYSSSLKSRAAHETIRFYTFPKNEEIRNEWIKFCKKHPHRPFEPKHRRVCDKHFALEDYADRIQASVMNFKPKRLKEDAVPSLNLPLMSDETPALCEEESDNSSQDFEIIYITGEPEVMQSEYEQLLKKYNKVVEENKHLKTLLRTYLKKESVRKKRKVPCVTKDASKLCDNARNKQR